MPNFLDDELKRIVKEESSKKNPQLAAQHFSLGEEALKSGEYEKARDHFQIALNWDPNDRYYAGLGDALLGLEKTNEAIWALEEAVRLDPENTIAQKILKATKSKIYYKEGVELHKEGNLVAAVRKYNKAEEAGMQEIPEIKEWVTEGTPISDWNSTERFAETLEELIAVLKKVQEVKTSEDNKEDVYLMTIKELGGVEFDSSFLDPFLQEVIKHHNTKHLGIVFSAMINKIIDVWDTVVLNLDKHDVARSYNDHNNWQVNNLGYRHEKGNLVIKGNGIILHEMCSRMYGGTIELNINYKGKLTLGKVMRGGKIKLLGSKQDESHEINIGPGMMGGSIYISNDSIEQYGSTDDYLLILGNEMRGGEIIVDGNVYYTSIGTRMEELPIGTEGGPDIRIKGDVFGLLEHCSYIGNNMKGGHILIEGDVKYAEVGTEMQGYFGLIHITGNVGSFSSDWYTEIAKNMSSGRIFIDGNAHARNIGKGMNGGRVIIKGSAYNIASPLLDGRIDVEGPIATIARVSYDQDKNQGVVYLGDKKILPCSIFYLKGMFGSGDTITFKNKGT